MPPFNREPHIYQGYVISQIGSSMGERVDMEFKNAQACVSSGTHRWADDETPMSNSALVEIERRQKELADQVEADRLAYEKTLTNAKSIESLLASVAQPIHFAQDTDGKLYLGRPLPKTTLFSAEVLASGKLPVATRDGDTVTITLENATAVYQIVAGQETDTLTATLESADVPELNEIPEDWRERHFLANISLAKDIRRMDRKDKLSKADAEAIIEEWTKHDPVRADQPTEEEIAKAGEEGNQDDKPFLDKDGNPVSAEEKARLDALEFANDSEND